MNKKKILLISLLTIPTYTLLVAEDDDITISVNDTTSVYQPMSEQNVLLDNKPEENVTLEQRFICEKKEQDGGVVCQMYECLNGECQVATAIKANDDEDFNVKQSSLAVKTPVFDFDEDEILCPVVGRQTISDEDDNDNDNNNTKQTKPSEIELMTDIDIQTQNKIEKLEQEIQHEESRCERAESDPRQQAICEDASAEVQWKKEKIKELENQ